MAVKNPLISIVILNWNGLEDTKLCLEHVFKLDYDNYEVIVVDNGSSEKDKKYLSKLKNIIYIDNPVNRGFAGGQVDGYKKAKGEFILLLNNDAVIKADYIKQALPLFEDKKVAAVGGRSYFWNEKEPIFNESNRFYSYMEIDPIRAETTLQMSDNNIQEVNTISGSAVMVRKDVIEKYGYLWEPYFAYYEETDLFARYKRAGYQILYNPKMQIWHKNGASSGAQGGSFFFYFHIYRNRYMYAMRNFDDKYLKLFKKDYYSLYRMHLREAVLGPEQLRIAKAYTKAILYVMLHRGTLLKERHDLDALFNHRSYSKEIIKENTKISFVIDATNLDEKRFSKLYKKIATRTNLFVEYIFVVNDHHKALPEKNNIQIIVDRGYFDTPSINLGCLVSRSEWLIICSNPHNIVEPTEYIDKIVGNFHTNISLIRINDSSIIIRKSLYKQAGGLWNNGSDKKQDYISNIINYAYLDGTLSVEYVPKIDPSDKEHLTQKISIDKTRYLTPKSPQWEKVLNRYYRLRQLDNFIKWVLNPNIKLRLKAGRTKNLLLFSFTLNRKKLATELKHIQNELTRERSNYIEAFILERHKIKRSTREQFKDISTIPVFIVCYNRVTDLTVLVKKLEKFGLKKITFIDNASTYPPLLDYYNKTPYQVLKMKRNAGHTVPWSEDIIRVLTPYEYYIVTDPDVIPTDECMNAPAPIFHLLKLHKKYKNFIKVGFGLKIDDLPDHYRLKDNVIGWESQFWKYKIEEGVYEAPLDTTFALYKPTTYSYTLFPSIRTGEPYLARHIPWYSNSNLPSAEDHYYTLHMDTNISSWNNNTLPDRYVKEMSKKRKRKKSD